MEMKFCPKEHPSPMRGESLFPLERPPGSWGLGFLLECGDRLPWGRVGALVALSRPPAREQESQGLSVLLHSLLSLRWALSSRRKEGPPSSIPEAPRHSHLHDAGLSLGLACNPEGVESEPVRVPPVTTRPWAVS